VNASEPSCLADVRQDAGSLRLIQHAGGGRTSPMNKEGARPTVRQGPEIGEQATYRAMLVTVRRSGVLQGPGAIHY
jgi:hypothetical protein